MDDTDLKALCFNIDQSNFPAEEALQDIIDGLIEWVELECGVTFSEEELPKSVQFFVRDAFLFMRANSGKTSESLDGYSYSVPDVFPENVLRWLKPFRKKMRFS